MEGQDTVHHGLAGNARPRYCSCRSPRTFARQCRPPVRTVQFQPRSIRSCCQPGDVRVVFLGKRFFADAEYLFRPFSDCVSFWHQRRWPRLEAAVRSTHSSGMSDDLAFAFECIRQAAADLPEVEEFHLVRHTVAGGSRQGILPGEGPRHGRGHGRARGEGNAVGGSARHLFRNRPLQGRRCWYASGSSLTRSWRTGSSMRGC